jgi:diacylglycerol kinase family enzyme
VVFEYAAPFPYQLDGDYLGETNKLIFTWEPEAVRLIIPTGERR